MSVQCLTIRATPKPRWSPRENQVRAAVNRVREGIARPINRVLACSWRPYGVVSAKGWGFDSALHKRYGSGSGTGESNHKATPILAAMQGVFTPEYLMQDELIDKRRLDKGPYR